MPPFKSRNQSKITGIIVTLFFMYVILSSIIINNIDDGRLAMQPVWEEVFGKYIVVGHLGVISGIILLIITIIILNNKESLQSPIKYYQKKEVLAFKQKHNFLVNNAVSKRKRRFAMFIAIFSTFLPALVPYLYWLLWDVSFNATSVMLGVALMFVLFYGAIDYLMKKQEPEVFEFIHKVNDHFDNTDLKMMNYGTEDSMISLSFSINLSGIFLGREVSLTSSVTESKTPSRTKVDSKVDVIFETTSHSTILISEYDNTEIESIQSKYKIEGNYEKISDDFRNSIEEELRFLPLKIENQKITYQVENSSILPFYTLEGIILYLEFLNSLANEIEHSPYV